ncbi:MAG: hypothetical protein ACJA0Q_000003 [Saprospiraceae bacterium]|jgi:uncharacterized protein (TIGR02117 family)
MKILKKVFIGVAVVLAFPIAYFSCAYLMMYVTVNDKEGYSIANKVVYLNTNGVHLDVVIPREDINSSLLSGIRYKEGEDYISFGWGDENFYLNTPTWGELTFQNAFKAMFLNSSTLMHLTRYKEVKDDWTKVELNEFQLNKLNNYILNSFKLSEDNQKMYIPEAGYSYNDNFYKANGSYSCFKTCNSWVNIAFKESELKACYWTPFDFGLIKKYD